MASLSEGEMMKTLEDNVKAKCPLEECEER